MRGFLMILAAALLVARGDSDGGGNGTSSGSSSSAGGAGQGGAGGGEGGAGGGGGSAAAMPVEGESNVVRSCAPNDGPGYTVVIGLSATTCGAAPAGEVLRISIWSKLDMLAGSTWDVAQNSPDGFAAYYPGGDPSNLVFSNKGTLVIKTWDEAASITGSYDVELTDGTHIAGDFDATPCLVEMPMCG